MDLDDLVDHFIARDSQSNIALGTSAFQDMSSIFTQQNSIVTDFLGGSTVPNKPIAINQAAATEKRDGSRGYEMVQIKNSKHLSQNPNSAQKRASGNQGSLSSRQTQSKNTPRNQANSRASNKTNSGAPVPPN
jgi:hypothetical protein